MCWATHEDITEREDALETSKRVLIELEDQNRVLQQREQELNERNRRFDLAISTMAQGLCMLDAQLRVIDCNDRYRHLFSLPAHIARPGASLWDMVQTDFRRRGIPWVDLMLRRRQASSALNLGPRHRLSALASIVAVLALVRRRLRLATGATLILVALNARFYILLARRRGPSMAVTGIGLHALHHLVGVAAVPAGIVAHLLSRSREPR